MKLQPVEREPETNSPRLAPGVGEVRFLEALLAITSLGTGADDPNQALGEILSRIGLTIPADSGSVALLNPDSGRLETGAKFGFGPGDGDPAFALGQGIPGWVAWHGKPALVPDPAAAPRYRAVPRHHYGRMERFQPVD